MLVSEHLALKAHRTIDKTLVALSIHRAPLLAPCRRRKRKCRYTQDAEKLRLSDFAKLVPQRLFGEEKRVPSRSHRAPFFFLKGNESPLLLSVTVTLGARRWNTIITVNSLRYCRTFYRVGYLSCALSACGFLPQCASRRASLPHFVRLLGWRGSPLCRGLCKGVGAVDPGPAPTFKPTQVRQRFWRL
jgi:hypothetical protein